MTERDHPHVLYRMYDASRRLLYVGLTMNVSQRFATHRGEKPWWPSVATIQLQHFATRSEVEAAERAAINAEQPRYNVVHKARTAVATLPPRGQTPIQRFRMAAMRWTRLGKTARTEDKTASQVINELVEWYLRDRPTSQLTRPPRVELSEEERVAVEEAEGKRLHGQNGGSESS